MFENATDKELEVELARRKAAREVEARNRKQAYAYRMTNGLTREMVDLFVPEHCRTSCSDENVHNGWGTHSSGASRCVRCALLEALRGEWDGDFELSVILTRAL